MQKVTNIGGVIANATQNADGTLTDHGKLNYSGALELQDIQDHRSESNKGFNISTSIGKPQPGKDANSAKFPSGSTTIGMQSLGNEQDQLTKATMGQGTVKNATDSTHRDINNTQEITRDQVTGLLAGSVTVDHRLLTESGRKQIVQEQKDLPENGKLIAGSTATGGLILGSGLVGLLDENGSVKDATTLTKNNANAAYDAELAAKLQLIQEGKLDNLVDNQDILNQYNQGLIKGTSNQNTQVNLNVDLYNATGGKVDATTNISNKTDIYLDRNAQNNSVGLITHENAHQQGFGEGSSNTLGKLGETAFNVNSWVNSKNIDAAKTQIQTAPKIETSGKNDAQAQLDLLKANEQKQLGQIINGDKFEDQLSPMESGSYGSLKKQFEKQCTNNQSAGCKKLANEIVALVEKGRTVMKSETFYMSEDKEFGGGEKIVVTHKPNDLVACIISSSSVCMVTNKMSNGEYVLQPANKQQVEQYNKQKQADKKYVTELGQQAYLAGCTSVGISAFVCQVYHAAGQPYPLTGKTPTNDERVLLAAGATAQVTGVGVGVLRRTPQPALFWGTWRDYPKVTVSTPSGPQLFASINGRLYSEHAVARMQPSFQRYSSGGAEGTVYNTVGRPTPGIMSWDGHSMIRGRSISPTFVEEIIKNTKPIKQVNGNWSYRSGDLNVILSPDKKRVITIISESK